MGIRKGLSTRWPICGSTASCCSRGTDGLRTTCWRSSSVVRASRATPKKLRAAFSGRRLQVYRHTQFGTPIVAGTVLALAGATAVVASLSKQTLAAAPWLVVALYGLIALAFVLFFRLTVVVDDEAVKAV